MSENIQEKIKDRVIDLIALGAGGRLIVFKPEKLDKDLIIEKKGDYKKKTISLKVFEKEFIDSEKIKKEINPEENFYLMFVYFDIVKQNISDNFLVIPSADFKGKGKKEKDFSKFLVNKKDFVRFLISEFEKNEIYS